jgi:hypothetical protein
MEVTDTSNELLSPAHLIEFVFVALLTHHHLSNPNDSTPPTSTNVILHLPQSQRHVGQPI